MPTIARQPDTLIRAGALADGVGRSARPGAVLMRAGRIVAAGEPSAIGSVPAARTIDRPDDLLVPGLVNAHAHLDLSHLGPQPYPGRFSEWVDGIRAGRAMTDAEIDRAVRCGIELARAGGTALLGDIAGVGSLQPWRTMRELGMAGVSFVEQFGLGPRQGRAIERMAEIDREQPVEADGVRLGLQPHAPYSCGPDVYRAAASLGRPVATHLAETLEELAFCRTRTGQLVEMLRAIGVWDESIEPLGGHPVDALAEHFAAAPWVIAHLNYIEDRHIELLSRWPVSVAYCPRASAYFGHPATEHPPHAYRAMHDIGVNVCLGTDGLPCLDTPGRISVLDEMRLLFRREGTPPQTLLQMATVNGAAALGFDRDAVTFAPGGTAGIISARFDPDDPADALTQVLRRDDGPAWVMEDARNMSDRAHDEHPYGRVE